VVCALAVDFLLLPALLIAFDGRRATDPAELARGAVGLEPATAGAD
jgi:hypothetical protein